MRTTTSVETLETGELDSPIGRIVIAMHRGRICALNFFDRWTRAEAALRTRFGDVEFQPGGGAEPIVESLEAYFRGMLDSLAAVSVDTGGTVFQQRVWTALRGIPVGHTWSYSELAKAIGSPGAVRAVGAANGANPISIIIPCHRVIGADGSLTGYGGGVDRKRWLLDHEHGAQFPLQA